MGDLQRRQISALVLPLMLFLTLAPLHITLIKAELLTSQNIEKKFWQHRHPQHLEQCFEQKKLQCTRRELLATEINKHGDNCDLQTNTSRTTFKGKNIWCRDWNDTNSDMTVKLMRGQITMAEVYAKLARSKKETDLYNSLVKQSKACLNAIGEADLDIELQPRAFKQARKMDSILSIAEEKLYDCSSIPKKLRAMVQAREDNLIAQEEKTHFLAQLTTKTVPKPLHCLPQQLTVDYFSGGFQDVIIQRQDRLEDPSFYHYAIFSDNVLATSVVVNSAVSNAKEPQKHVFHIVTDRLNFRAMRMWFLLNPPSRAIVEVQSIDDFTWLNPSYCPALRHLGSPELKEYHFMDNKPSKSKYRNPKYLSILNHLRFYLPEIYPKLDKILFLDDDVVVQKDLTPLWSIDMDERVNGAVEACKGGFHTLADYLNFDIPIISGTFDPNDCSWAFGMNVFDLKQWRVHNITGVYHFWQRINEKENWKAWKLGSLPPALVAFYNQIYLLDASWHVLGLGYDPELSLTEIKNAAVIHYSGNCKPWMDCGIAKYKAYWSKYIMFDSPQIQQCKIGEYLGEPFAM